MRLLQVLALSQHVVLSVEQAIEQDIMQNANFDAQLQTAQGR